MKDDELKKLFDGISKENLVKLLVLARLLRFVPEFREELSTLTPPGERIPPLEVIEALMEKYKGAYCEAS